MRLKNPLLDYQQCAVDKLKKLKVGALFMEQGTGKTITALELCRLRLEAGKVDHILWLCPCSTKQSVKEEIQKQAPPRLRHAVTLCGIETLSRSIRVNDYLLLLTERFRCYLVVDESLLVKNPYTYRSQNVERLSSRCRYKLILNGMPISRNEADLYAQFRILDWRILGYQSYWSFAANHLEWRDGGPVRGKCRNTDYLARKIAPYTVQFLKRDCLALPDKHYDVSYFQLTDGQREHYNEVADALLFRIDEMHPETIYRLFTGLQAVTSGLRVDFCPDDNGYQHIVTSPFFPNPGENPRLAKVLSHIAAMESAREDGGKDNGKFILFCNYTYEIDSLCLLLAKLYGDAAVVRFDGSFRPEKRMQELGRFQEGARFLVANRECAGYSLNLQFCHRIIYCSNSWDLATRIQSEDRIHRLGQRSPISIRDICAVDTLDERILSSLHRKARLLESFRQDIQTFCREEIARWVGRTAEEERETPGGKGAEHCPGGA